MRILILFLAALCSALAAPAALAQETIRLRAISPLANDPAVIKYVANNAALASLPIPARGATPRSVILARCGSIQPAYVEQFQKHNPKLQIDDAIGSQDSSLVWPACLYVAVHGNGYPAKLRKNEVPAHVYMRLTGGGGGEQAVKNYFSGIDLQKVAKGATLSAPYVTRPVELTLETIGADAFWNGLQKEAKQAPGNETVIARIDPPKGAVIVAAEDTYGCKAQSGEPYKVKEVLAAFNRAKERAAAERVDLRRPRITVVDNGFFGADSRVAEAVAFDGSPFPKKMFVPETGSLIAKRFQYGKLTVFPINYSHDLTPDLDNTHGTHVTGLVLGGPAFRPHHDKLRGADGWADITILNVGVGKRQLLEGADQMLVANLLGDGRIVNLSITYDRDAYRSISSTFDDLFSTRRHLYIASAGNESIEVADKVYPAGFGGTEGDNVVTVAALGDDGRWASFSNQSARAVDLAAPGCEIQSWTQNTLADEAALSGTSQAAPLVTFAAALLRTFSGDLDVRYLKARLVASGSLLHPDDQEFTAYHVALNIPRALYWFDDYVRVRRSRPAASATDKPEWETVEYLGTVNQLTGTRCKASGSPSNPRDIWSFKRGPLKDWLYLGKGNWRLSSLCEAAVGNAGKLVFTPSHRITPEGLVDEKPVGESFALTEVEEVIFRSPRFKD